MDNFVTAVEKSSNSKTGLVSVTYAPIQSCPETCPFLDKGCYAQLDNCGFTTRRINKNVPMKAGPLKIAQEEAEAISRLKGDKPLRLHVVGDCKTPKAAEVLSLASNKYKSISNQPVWTHTHAWREVPRNKWGSISVLASCENFKDTKHAYERGYAICMVRWKEFDKSFKWNGFTMQPCLEITKSIQCNKCKLCFNDKKLYENKTIICFFPHGAKRKQVEETLKRL